jgi:hypothetical protein
VRFGRDSGIVPAECGKGNITGPSASPVKMRRLRAAIPSEVMARSQSSMAEISEETYALWPRESSMYNSRKARSAAFTLIGPSFCLRFMHTAMLITRPRACDTAAQTNRPYPVS